MKGFGLRRQKTNALPRTKSKTEATFLRQHKPEEKKRCSSPEPEDILLSMIRSYRPAKARHEIEQEAKSQENAGYEVKVGCPAVVLGAIQAPMISEHGDLKSCIRSKRLHGHTEHKKKVHFAEVMQSVYSKKVDTTSNEI